ncbi:hypothetical protein FA95DRAFT_586450 [Auriscalpium vulgare]|uniref:Uncharacterized protein n=1 Tax=Auriscalpium vulgare TaxID=40419 RepID=A0ACB8RDR7_9AGAM|nr:hypothetical protein FA95DRAFT_586450 [Auriscalpium vulgare]
MAAHPQVLIVGAGPSGLVSALTLRKNGIPVRVIERRKVPHGAIRGTAIQPRMQEILESLGMLDDVRAISTPPSLMGVHSVGKEITEAVAWADEADASPGTPHPTLISTSQAGLEGVLRQHLERFGTKIEMGVELVDLKQDNNKVAVQLKSMDVDTTAEFSYVVGADGAKGTIREMLGVSFVGESKAADRMFTANVECTDIDREHWHRFGQFHSKVFLLKPIEPAPVFQVQSLGPELPTTLPTNTAGIQEMLNEIAQSTDIKLRNASWISEWRANIRMADKFSVGRVFLVGDAAHCHSPAGGQGTNTGVTDALNLSWKLALVLRGLSPPALLDSYSAERTPVVAEMLNVTSALHRIMWVSALSAGGEEKGREKDPMWRPKHLQQLGVNYRWSAIVLEGREGEEGDQEGESNPYGIAGTRLRAGDRAPDARVLDVASQQEKRFFELWAGASRHTVLVFAGHVPEQQDVHSLAKYDELGVARIWLVQPTAEGQVHRAHYPEGVVRLADAAGQAYAGYGVGAEEVTFVVVRPDGMAGAFARDVASVHRYFSLVLV